MKVKLWIKGNRCQTQGAASSICFHSWPFFSPPIFCYHWEGVSLRTHVVERCSHTNLTRESLQMFYFSLSLEEMSSHQTFLNYSNACGGNLRDLAPFSMPLDGLLNKQDVCISVCRHIILNNLPSISQLQKYLLRKRSIRKYWNTVVGRLCRFLS